MLILVRHAHAGVRGEWKPADECRPLNSHGRAQAQQLPHLLAGYDVGRLVTSSAKRCCDTLQPLAQHLDLPLEIHPELESSNHDAAVALALSVAEGDRSIAVICTHGEMVKRMIGALVGGSMQVKRVAKCAVWVIQTDPNTSNTSILYLPAPSVMHE